MDTRHCMKEISMKILTIIMVVFCQLNIVYAQGIKEVENLHLLIRHEADSTDPLALRVEFINQGENEIKLLKSFSNEKNLCIWFCLDVIDADGTPVLGIPSGGKISMRGNNNYVALSSKEGFSFVLNADKLIPLINKGEYKLKLLYNNQYGEECFKGELKSNTLDIVIP